MKRYALALLSAISGCMPVHDVTLGADMPKTVVADAGGIGEPDSADATVGLPESLDAGSVEAGSAPDTMADAGPRDAGPRDAADSATSTDAARADAGRPDSGDAGEPHDDDDTRAP